MRGGAPGVAAALLLAGLGIAGWFVWRQAVAPVQKGHATSGDTSAIRSAQRDGRPVQAQLWVSSLFGDVQFAAADRPWQNLEEGRALAVNDRLRAAADARVELRLGRRSSMRLEAGGELEVRALGDDVVIGVPQGKVKVDYEEGGTLRVEGRDRRVAATVRRGRFSMTSRGRVVAVDVRSGSVSLESPRGETRVAEGQQGMATADSAPQRVEGAPDVWVQMARAHCWRLPGHSLVNGRVPQGTRVWVGDRRVDVRPDGTYRVTIPAAGAVTVRMEDVWENRRFRTVQCVRRRVRGRVRDVEIRWGDGG